MRNKWKCDFKWQNKTSTLIPSTTNTAAPTPCSRRRTKNQHGKRYAIGLKSNLRQLSQNHCKEITSREATLRKCKADLKQKETRSKRQQKLCENQKCKAQSIEEQTGGKTFEKVARRRKHVDNEKLIAELIAAHKSRRSEIIRTVKSLDLFRTKLGTEKVLI